MKRNNLVTRKNKVRVCVLLLAAAGALAACGTGSGQEIENAETAQEKSGKSEAQQPVLDDFAKEQVIGDIETPAGDQEEPADKETITTDNLKADEIKNRFGENCISEQTFEVELSEYDGKVWFVPYAPAEEAQQPEIQIVQDGEILTTLQPYVPDRLAGQSFTSIDAVAFWDINYDNYTDIALIETYGNTAFAVVYYGFAHDEEEYYRYFDVQWDLSDMISDKASPVTIAGIRDLLGNKKNGEFTSYQEAYTQIVKLWELTYGSEVYGVDLTYDLIYVDGDDIPELVISDNGFWVTLYTYHDGRTYALMDYWSYGVMGNVGYEYIPKGNRLRNYNSDYAGAVRYTTYMSMNDRHSLETATQIITYNFDDANGDGYPDADEQDSIGYYSVSYVDGVEITDEQYAAYDAGEYEYIVGEMGLEEMMKELAE